MSLSEKIAPQNEFKPFAEGTEANILDQSYMNRVSL